MISPARDEDIFTTWQTPLYHNDLTLTLSASEVDGMNQQLKRLILEREGQTTSVSTFGVIGATKTSLDILRWDHPAVDWLRDRILDAVEDISKSVGADAETEASVDLIAEGWAVVYRQGASHRLHTHHESAWSGVYYIDTGGVGSDAGHLQLLDPRPAAIARQATTGVEYVRPKPGVMVAFPSWLPHSVKATLHGGGNGTRICVAFNAGYEERIDKE